MNENIIKKCNRNTVCVIFSCFCCLSGNNTFVLWLYKWAETVYNGKFLSVFSDMKTVGTLLYSAVIAFVTTIVCLAIAYPIAYILARGGYKKRNVLILLFVMPMWINFTLRITALKEILTAFEGNLAFHPFLNTIIGMTYDFLPFMILPIYNTIIKIDESYIEAAADLGAKSYRVF